MRTNLRWMFVAGLFAISLSLFCQPSLGYPPQDDVPAERVE